MSLVLGPENVCFVKPLDLYRNTKYQSSLHINTTALHIACFGAQ